MIPLDQQMKQTPHTRRKLDLLIPIQLVQDRVPTRRANSSYFFLLRLLLLLLPFLLLMAFSKSADHSKASEGKQAAKSAGPATETTKAKAGKQLLLAIEIRLPPVPPSFLACQLLFPSLTLTF